MQFVLEVVHQTQLLLLLLLLLLLHHQVPSLEGMKIGRRSLLTYLRAAPLKAPSFFSSPAMEA